MSSPNDLNTLHFTVHYHPNGTGIYRSVLHFTSAIRQSGGIAHVVAIRMFEGDVDHGTLVDTVTYVEPAGGWLLRDYCLPKRAVLVDLVNSFSNVGVVFIHGLYRGHVDIAIRFAELRKIPVVVVPHGALDPWVFTYRSWRKRLWVKFQESRLRDATFLFATDAERRKARESAKVFEVAESRVVSWPVRTSNTVGLPECRSRTFLFVGRIHSMKRVLEMVSSFCKWIREADQSWDLRVVGPVEDEAYLESIKSIIPEEFRERVSFLGALSGAALESEYRTARWLVLFSNRENFGHVVAEAMSYGTPSLLGPGVDLGPLVASKNVGVVLSRDSEEAYLGGYRECAAMSEEDYLVMSQLCVSIAKREFAFDRFAESLSTLCSDAADHYRQKNSIG